jgi:hypothetical protein
VGNAASLPSISKKERFKALFVSGLSPEVIVDDVQKSERMIKPKEVGLHQT